ncbi:MAG: selenocysteine-specific translation elongation factor [Alphaproteobacteria bacterium]|nr:selenocysteine-specific translation elongation factor [Alphaproteobacteria bacterium]
MSTAPRPLPDAFIVGTAGHIDHGKTSLVRALTGVDLDALPEERRRGITIALGFTTLNLPSGRVASFVDVPGHERLVRTMIAGACGIDAVLLCVSAVEGVMPQTREHLDILSLLGVERGVVALTMGDLVDEDLALLAEEDVRDAVEGTFLEGAPILLTSAEDRRGLDALIAALDALPVAPRRADGPFRLPVDRAFVRRGFGTVITGTVLSGAIQDGDEVVVLPQGDKARVRGLQVHGAPRSRSASGYRTALNLAGVEKDDLPRGTVVASPTGVPVTSILDVRYRHLADAPPLESGARVRLLIGTAEVMAVIDGLDAEPGAGRYAQLRTAEPVVALPGDRFVLRRESPVTTLGGGVVLDPWAPRARKRERLAAAAALARLEEGDRGVLLERAGPVGLPQAEARVRLGALPEDAARLGDRVLTAAQVDQLQRTLLERLDAWHADHPLSWGPNRRALLRGVLTPLESAAFDALLGGLMEAGHIALDGPRVRRAGWQPVLDDAAAQTRDLILERLEAAGLAALSTAELLAGCVDGDALLALLQESGTAVRIGGRYHPRAALDDMVARVQAALAEEGELTPGKFKDLTGLTRKNAIPLLEWLDGQRVTRRRGDSRVAYHDVSDPPPSL